MKTIQILAFQGTGLKYAYTLDPTDDPLLIVGHVGFQFDSPTIYGFHPPEWAIEAQGGPRAALEHLRSRRDMPGTIQDDTPVFHRAYELSLSSPAAMGNRLVVYAMPYVCEDEKSDAIQNRLNQWYTDATVLRYGYPPITENTPYDNCATVQRLLSMNIIDFQLHKGEMEYYLRIFRIQGERWILES